MAEHVHALKNRSLRTIRTELEFLADTSIISQAQLDTILSNLPDVPQYSRPTSRASESQQASNPFTRSATTAAAFEPRTQPPPAAAAARSPSPAPVPAASSPVAPVEQFNDMHLFHRLRSSNSASPAAQVPAQATPPPPMMPPQAPPAYTAGPPILCMASAVYAYQPTDAGDLELAPNDRIQVLEHMNNDWWRGRNERTGLEGIFPRTYVNVIEDKGVVAPPPPPMHPQPTPQPMAMPMQPQPSGPMAYGNMPMAVAQGPAPPAQPMQAAPPVDQQQQQGGHPHMSKVEEGGKKFGKKIGNAAIFGAGATIGSNLVNSIF